MSDINPMLLLVLSLVSLGMTITWGLSFYVAVKLCRRRGRKAWPWVLALLPMGFIPYGPVFPCIAYLAHASRRNVPLWVCLQVAGVGALLALVLGPTAGAVNEQFKWLPLWGQMLAMLAAIGLALSPLLVLGLLGPRRSAPDRAGPDGPLIRAEKLHKTYRLDRQDLHVLRGVSLSVGRGEFVAILGASGSGKSTLLHLLGLLDAPDSGSIVLDGPDSAELSGPQRDAIRSRDIGFVFQFYHLLPELDVVENTLLPAMTSLGVFRWPAARAQLRKKAVDILTKLGLEGRLDHRPRQLSGGEQQRVAIARALMNSPKLLLADEPTGNLDSKTGSQIVKLLKQLNAQTGQTIILVTHDQSIAQTAGRVLHLRDGVLG